MVIYDEKNQNYPLFPIDAYFHYGGSLYDLCLYNHRFNI